MKEFKSYLINCGDGLMNLVVFPDNKTMLFDCNVRKDDEDKIVDFLTEVLPENKIDIFVNSHRDEDHIRGVKIINDKFPIGSIWDSGQSGSSTDGECYQEYMSLKRQIKNDNSNRIKELMPSLDPIINENDYAVYCLNSKNNIDGSENDDSTDDKIQHTNCLVLLIQCYGKKILMTGDSDWKTWKKITNNSKDNDDFLKKIDLLIASHHGSRTFFTSEENDCIDVKENEDTTFVDSIVHLNPTITLISCDKDSKFNFPNKEALKLYKENTSNNQVYSTAEFGTYTCSINEYGIFSVEPYDFLEMTNSRREDYFFLSCYVNGEKKEKEYIGNKNDKLLFKVNTDYFEGYKKIDYIEWTVSNNGVGEDADHQEIYQHCIKNDYSFNRELIYKGIHKLKCKIIFKDIDAYVCKYFVVERF